MPYKYDQPTHSLIQLPEMKEPELTKSCLYKHSLEDAEICGQCRRNYDKKIELYKEHIASLKTYDVGVPKEKVPDYWKVEGQTLGEGVDFKLDWDLVKSLYHGKPTDIVAIPIQEEGWRPSGNIPGGKTWGFPPKEWEKEKEDEVKPDIKKQIENAAALECIYQPKYGGKDHSGYDTMMLYEVNGEREECFEKGAYFGYNLALKNNLVECKEKDSQDELWKHVFDVFLSKGDVYIWDYKAAVTELQNEGFSIYKK